MLNHEAVQAAISARLDGERSELDDDVVDTHIANCPQCRAFRDKAAALSGSLSFVEPADSSMAPPQDLSEVILAGVEPHWEKAASARQASLAVIRLAVLVVGLAFAVWAVAQVVAASGMAPTSADGSVLDPSADTQRASLLMEGAAVRFGLASGLLFAAWRPASAAGLLPAACTMFAFAFGFAMRDIALSTLAQQQVYFLVGTALAALSLGWLAASNKGFSVRGALGMLGANPQ